MPTKLCAHPRCGSAATYRGRCADHARITNRATHRNRRIYSSAKWKHTRRRVLFEQPLCPGVLGEACGEVATDVHHVVDIDDGGDPWDRANLLGLCHACHARLTRKEQATR